MVPKVLNLNLLRLGIPSMFISIIWNYKTKVRRLLKIMSTNTFLILTKFLAFWCWVYHFVFICPSPSASLLECNIFSGIYLVMRCLLLLGTDWLARAGGRVGVLCGGLFLVWGECVVCVSVVFLRFNYGQFMNFVFSYKFSGRYF